MSQENEVMASEEKQVTEAKFDGASLGGVENLGGPTPQNSKPDDESNKLKTPSQTQAASPKTKPSAASPQKAESVEAENAPGEDLIEIDLSADVAALTEGEDLSEEFKAKAATIFEAAVVSRLNEELDRVHKEYAGTLSEEVEAVKTTLAEQVDEYLLMLLSSGSTPTNSQLKLVSKQRLLRAWLQVLKKFSSRTTLRFPRRRQTSLLIW